MKPIIYKKFFLNSPFSSNNNSISQFDINSNINQNLSQNYIKKNPLSKIFSYKKF